MRMRMILAAGLLLLAGCGGEPTAPTPPDPQTLLKTSREALAAASSYHVGGTLDPGDTIDLTVAGADSTGTYADPEGGEQTFIRVGDEIYIKGNETFLEQFIADPATVTALAGHWTHPSADNPDFSDVGTGFGTLIPLSDSPRTGETVTIGDAIAFALVLADGTILYVAAEGPPYPLRLVMPQGTIAFDAFNQPVTITPPPADQVVPLD